MSENFEKKGMHMRKSLTRMAMAASLAVTNVPGTPAPGAECLGVTVPDAMKAGGARLVLNGLCFRIPVT